MWTSSAFWIKLGFPIDKKHLRSNFKITSCAPRDNNPSSKCVEHWCVCAHLLALAKWRLRFSLIKIMVSAVTACTYFLANQCLCLQHGTGWAPGRMPLKADDPMAFVWSPESAESIQILYHETAADFVGYPGCRCTECDSHCCSKRSRSVHFCPSPSLGQRSEWANEDHLEQWTEPCPVCHRLLSR